MAQNDSNGVVNTGIVLPGIFGGAGLEVYSAPTWRMVGEPREFNETECAAIDHVKIVAGKFGLSACFFIKGQNGKHFFIDIDKQDTSFSVDEVVKAEELMVKKLVNDYDPNLPKETLRVIRKVAPVVDEHPTNFDNPFNL